MNAQISAGISNGRAIKIFARLRWRLWKQSTTDTSAKSAAVVLVNVLTPIIGFAIAFLVFAVLRFNSAEDAAISAVLICATAALFTAGLGLAMGVAQPIPMQVVAVEPLTRLQRALGTLVTVAVGPAGIVAALFALGLAAGSARSLAGIPLAALCGLVFVTATFLLSRATSSLLGLLVQRVPWLGKALTALAGFGVYALYMVAVNALPNMSIGARRRIADDIAWAPIASIGRALGGPIRGGFGNGRDWLALGLTVLAIIPLLFVFAWGSERLTTSVPAVRRGRVEGAGRWRRLLGNDIAGVIAVRSVLTRMRTVRGSTELVTASGLGLAAMIMPVVLGGSPMQAFTGLGSEVIIYLFASNSFGNDGPALAHPLIAGASGRQLVAGKFRAALLITLPIGMVGAVVASILGSGPQVIPANMLLALAGLLMGGSLAVVQSAVTPFAVPSDDNPFAANGGALLPALMFFALLLLLAIAFIPVLIALYLALRTNSVAWVTAMAAVAVAYAWVIGVGARSIAARRFVGNEARILEMITPN